MSFIKAENISKSFSNTQALSGVSLSVPEGKIFGLLGPNGAGKTTFIRILNQILEPDSGTITIANKPLLPKDITRIGYLPEERGLYKKMKIGEQALYLAQLKGMQKNTAKKELLQWFKKFEILEWWDRKVEELSKGMQQKIQFIVTVLHKPEILILDEPFSGFDPVNADLIKQEILALNKLGTTIILSTHDMNSVEELCDNIALFNKSQKILDGAVNEIRSSYAKNEYEIAFKGYFDSITASLTTSYKIVNQTKENDITKIRIQLIENEILNNDIIKHFTSVGNIISYNEVLPSMNDIFIKLVGSKNEMEVTNE